MAPIIAICAGVALLIAFLFFRSGSSSVSGDSVTREGLKIDFSITSVIEPDKPLKAGEIAQVSLKFTDSTTGKPVTGLLPAAWIDPLRDGTKSEPEACKRSAATYLSGFVGIRPMIDLNSYYVVVLNADPSIAVIDPIIGVRGITKLLTQVILPGPPQDWARSTDENQVYVAMSSVNAVSFVPADGLTVPSGPTPSADGKQMSFTVRVDAAAPLGLRRLVLKNATGLPVTVLAESMPRQSCKRMTNLCRIPAVTNSRRRPFSTNC